MANEDLIPANDFCSGHNIEISFIRSLHDSGLIEIIKLQDRELIDTAQLRQLEKIVRLYYDLDINLEGIETITHLLQSIDRLRDEITGLKNRLRGYEEI
jgi:hypothetical protein